MSVLTELTEANRVLRDDCVAALTCIVFADREYEGGWYRVRDGTSANWAAMKLVGMGTWERRSNGRGKHRYYRPLAEKRT